MVLREAGSPDVTVNHSNGRTFNSAGVQAALAELQPQFRSLLLKRVPLDKAAAKLSELIDSKDGHVALKALVTALEHAGIVERHDQVKLLLHVQQQFVQTVGPVILDAIPREYHGQVLAALEDASQQARSRSGLEWPGKKV